VNPVVFGSRKAQSLRTLKGAATLKIQCDTAFTEHLPLDKAFYSLMLDNTNFGTLCQFGQLTFLVKILELGSSFEHHTKSVKK